MGMTKLARPGRSAHQLAINLAGWVGDLNPSAHQAKGGSGWVGLLARYINDLFIFKLLVIYYNKRNKKGQSLLSLLVSLNDLVVLLPLYSSSQHLLRTLVIGGLMFLRTNDGLMLSLKVAVSILCLTTVLSAHLHRAIILDLWCTNGLPSVTLQLCPYQFSFFNVIFPFQELVVYFYFKNGWARIFTPPKLSCPPHPIFGRLC